jgi:hypothetical protein
LFYKVEFKRSPSGLLFFFGLELTALCF